MKMKPIGNAVLVEKITEEERKEGGIIIPSVNKEKIIKSKVLELGTGIMEEDGKIFPFEVKVGDTVMHPTEGGTAITIDKKQYRIINAASILAIITN